MGDDCTTSPVASRRRLAFRPPQQSHAPSKTTDESGTHLSIAGSSRDLITEDATKRKAVKSWTMEDIMAYYDGLKMFGKDFESVAKMLAKKKIMKDKDQIKNYFYNSLKIIKQILAIEEDDMGDVPKDAKELFLALNACEWKKRTNNGKISSDKLKELLLDGVTTIRMNKKTIQIKTPPCPSLVRWFTKSRRAEKVPAEICLVLKPKSYLEESIMRSRSRNPLVKVKMNINEKVCRLFELLHKKWLIKSEEKDAIIRLWPGNSVEVGSLSVVETDASPFLGLSLNKLRKELEEIKEIKEGTVATANGNGLNMASNTKKVTSVYSVVYPRPFTLTDEIIASGITIKNVSSTVVAELYCVCGMKDSVELRYEIEKGVSNENSSETLVEPWKVMMDMFARDYGEAICGSRREEGESGIKRKESEDRCIPEESEPPKKRCAPLVQEKLVKGSAVAPVISEIVQQENDDFVNQLKNLKKNVRSAKNSRKGRIITQESVPPTPSPQPIQQAASSPHCKLIPKQNLSAVPPRPSVVGKKLSSTMTAIPRTDFSDIHTTPIKQRCEEELQKKRTDNFLGSLNTPKPTPQRPSMKTVLGDDISFSPSITRKSAAHVAEDDGDRCELTDILFGEISNTPTKYTTQSRHASDIENSQGNLGFSVTEVQQSYVDMISSSQDSRDFVMQHFKPKNVTRKKL